MSTFKEIFKPLFKNVLSFILHLLLRMFGSERSMSGFRNQSDRRLLKQCVAKVSPKK